MWRHPQLSKENRGPDRHRECGTFHFLKGLVCVWTRVSVCMGESVRRRRCKPLPAVASLGTGVGGTFCVSVDAAVRFGVGPEVLYFSKLPGAAATGLGTLL